MKRSQNLAGEEFRGRIGKTVYEWVDGQTVADGKIPRVLGMLSSTGMDIGRAIAP